MLKSHIRLAGLLFITLSACSSSEDYFPLTKNISRYYRITTEILDETKQQRQVSAIVEQAETKHGKVFIMRQNPKTDAYLQSNTEGIFRLGSRDRHSLTETWNAEPQKILPAKPQLDSTWTIKSELGLIESRTFARQDRLRNRTIPLALQYEVKSIDETVTVEAGTFSGCLALRATGSVVVRTDRGNASAEVIVTQHDWYAPGVGLVKSYRLEESESPFLKKGTFEQTLIALNR